MDTGGGRPRGSTCPVRPDFLKNIPDWEVIANEKTPPVSSLAASNDKNETATNEGEQQAQQSAEGEKKDTDENVEVKLTTPRGTPIRRSHSIPNSPIALRTAQEATAAAEKKAFPPEEIPVLSKTGKNVVAKRYHPGDELGKGAFARVYRGLDITSGSVVAIKQVDKHPLSERDAERIRQELELLQRLDHPNIVKLLDYEETEDFFSFVLEYVEGGSLHGLKCKYGNFPESLLGAYISQTLEGLLYLHSENVVHRDIKGANILLTKDGLCKLADFGSCSSTVCNNNKMTMIGTPFWMAPELISQTGGGLSSDIWSLACTMIELYTGQPPYWKLGPNVALFRMVEDVHPPLPTDMSPLLEDFFSRCFIRDESARGTCAELLKHPWIVKFKKANRRPLQDATARPAGSLRVPRKRLFQPQATLDVRPNSSRPGSGAARIMEELDASGAPLSPNMSRKNFSDFSSGRMTSSPNLRRMHTAAPSSAPTSPTPKRQTKSRMLHDKKKGDTFHKSVKEKNKEKNIERTINAWAKTSEEKKGKGFKWGRVKKDGNGSALKVELSDKGRDGAEDDDGDDAIGRQASSSPGSSPLNTMRGSFNKSAGGLTTISVEESVSESVDSSPRIDTLLSDSDGGLSDAKVIEEMNRVPFGEEQEAESEKSDLTSGSTDALVKKDEEKVPEEEAWRASVDEKNFEEKRERAEQELENLESLLTEEIDILGEDLNLWQSKLKDLVNEKVELEMINEELRSEIQKLFMKKEKLTAKRDFLKDFAAQQQSECDMLEHEIRAFLRRLQDEMNDSAHEEQEINPSQVSIRWMVPGAQCQARHSDTHKWDDAVITGIERVVASEDIHYNVIFIGSGVADKLKASDIMPPSSHWVPEGMRGKMKGKRDSTSFFKKKKK